VGVSYGLYLVWIELDGRFILTEGAASRYEMGPKWAQYEMVCEFGWWQVGRNEPVTKQFAQTQLIADPTSEVVDQPVADFALK
jgi:hypothetical protein